MEVFGSKASVETDNRTDSQVILCNDNGGTGQKPLWFLIERYKDAYLPEIQSFVNAVLKETNVAVDGDDGLAAVLIGLCRYRIVAVGEADRLQRVREEPFAALVRPQTGERGVRWRIWATGCGPSGRRRISH